MPKNRENWWKMMKIANIVREFCQNVCTTWANFNEIFEKYVTYDYIKTHKKTVSHSF